MSDHETERIAKYIKDRKAAGWTVVVCGDAVDQRGEDSQRLAKGGCNHCVSPEKESEE